MKVKAMRLFDWFSGASGVRVADDKVWLTADAKLRGICEEAMAWRDKRGLVLVVAHFESTLAQAGGSLKTYLHRDPIVTAAALSKRISGAKERAEGQLYAILSEDLRRGVIGRTPGADRGTAVVVAERFPIRDPDDAVCDLAKSLPLPCDLVFHVSMDDPLFKLFGDSERIRKLFTSMGISVSASQPIASRLLSRQLKRAQASVAKKRFANVQSKSPDEWFRANMPRFSD